MSIDLPSYIDPESWLAFCEMRAAKGRRTPFTERAAKMILKTLAQFHDAGHDCSSILDQSTLHGWSDVYPLKDRIIPKKVTNDAERTAAYLAETVPEVSAERRAEVAKMLKETRAKIRRVA